MNLDPDRFSKAVVETICKRAGNYCSNPECKALTTGPSATPEGAIVLGEAAHIYGAKEKSSRYDSRMTSAERSSITNAIWLCRNCHKTVDDNPIGYPVGVLFEWKNTHEEAIGKELGRTNENIRKNVAVRQIDKIGELTYRAKQVLIEKPIGWEYFLTVEILRSTCSHSQRRWRALKKGLYAKNIIRIESTQSIDWVSDRFSEIASLIPALATICNSEFQEAWGLPGEPGSEEAIIETCKLFGENCDQLLQWEERVRFVSLPENIREIGFLMKGIGGRALEQVGALPSKLARIFEKENLQGTYQIDIIIDLPEDFERKFDAAFERLKDTIYEI